MFGKFQSPVVGGGASLSVTGPVTLSGGELSLDITGISAAKRLTILFGGLDHTGATANDHLIMKLGAGGSVQSTGYSEVGCWAGVAGNGGFYNDSTFFRIPQAGPGNLFYGTAVFEHMGSNLWSCNLNGALPTTIIFYTGGLVQLTGSLTNWQLSTVAGTASFVAGGEWSYILES